MFGEETPLEILIMEPCNYASNIAFYHSALRVCDYENWEHFDLESIIATKRMFSTLAAGSAFMHASHTELGHCYDTSMIGVIAFIAYRQIVKKIGGTSNMIKCLSDKPCTDPIDLAEQAAFFSSKLPISHWHGFCEN